MYDKLTKSDIEKMKEEIDYRRTVVRKHTLEELKAAKAQGDLSENYEYKTAKRERGRNESRIRYLDKMIKTAKIIEDHSSDDQVGLNKLVTVYFEDDDEVETYKVTTTIRGNSIEGRVSIDSPIGKALMGHKVGDRVEVKVDENTHFYVQIRDIKQGDDNDEIRTY
jgi:transcription elongation factor GreA